MAIIAFRLSATSQTRSRPLNSSDHHKGAENVLIGLEWRARPKKVKEPAAFAVVGPWKSSKWILRIMRCQWLPESSCPRRQGHVAGKGGEAVIAPPGRHWVVLARRVPRRGLSAFTPGLADHLDSPAFHRDGCQHGHPFATGAVEQLARSEPRRTCRAPLTPR